MMRMKTRQYKEAQLVGVGSFLFNCERDTTRVMLQNRKAGKFLIRPHANDRSIRPLLNWCRSFEAAIVGKIVPNLSIVSCKPAISIPVSVAASETAVLNQKTENLEMHHLEENIMSLFQLDLWQESVRNLNDSWEGLIFMLYGVRQGVAFTLQGFMMFRNTM